MALSCGRLRRDRGIQRRDCRSVTGKPQPTLIHKRRQGGCDPTSATTRRRRHVGPARGLRVGMDDADHLAWLGLRLRHRARGTARGSIFGVVIRAEQWQG